jgi:hypothetical protein
MALCLATTAPSSADGEKTSGVLSLGGTTVSYDLPADHNAAGSCDAGYGLGIAGVLQWSSDPSWHSGRDWDDVGCDKGDSQIATANDMSLFFSNLDFSANAFQMMAQFEHESFSRDRHSEDGRNDWNAEDVVLHLETQIKLGTMDSAGPYQFALISSGSARLQIDTGDGKGFVTILNNTGHDGGFGWLPERMQCSDFSISMSSSISLPAILDFVPGMDDQETLTLLWRKVSSSSNDPSNCRPDGRGWQVLSPQNFKLPPQISGNPCISPSPGPSSSESDPLACLVSSPSAVALDSSSISVTGNASISGNVVLMGASTLEVGENAIVRNDVYTRFSENIHMSGKSSPGKVVLEDLGGQQSSIADFSAQLDSLMPSQVLSSISTSKTFQGNGGLNVIRVLDAIQMSGSEALVLQGSANDQFVFLVGSGGISFTGNSSIKTSGALSPSKVLFLVNKGGSITVSGSGSVSGTFIASRGSASLSGNAQMNGELAADGAITLSGNASIKSPLTWCPGIELTQGGPSPSPQPAPSPSVSVTASPSPSISPSASPSPSSSPSPTPESSPSPTPDPSVSPSPSVTPDPTSTPSPTPDPSVSPSPSVTPDPTSTPSPTPDPSVSPSPSVTVSASPSPTPDPTISPSPSPTPSPSPSPSEAAPEIFGLTYSTTTTTMTVSWTTTVPTTGIMTWGIYPDMPNTSNDASMSISHSITLTGLAQSTFYDFIEGGCTAAGVCVSDLVQTAETQ